MLVSFFLSLFLFVLSQFSDLVRIRLVLHCYIVTLVALRMHFPKGRSEACHWTYTHSPTHTHHVRLDGRCITTIFQMLLLNSSRPAVVMFRSG
ncbi:uncharacterized protein F4822DRAFT_408408 [Hypoxylon trugodes]|uniref:uncharacterized protein n=1 Tax=Hypoxylon trugodes TaxID=326681 RepID=UPI0021A20665|nr:uncharacterized protein F4822DRAFT_408408 [Hypoxylon trugodes]KAI1388025.1 hypothetical protein F4822DRAFT_408408 [Hypoxylon trugodes]